MVHGKLVKESHVQLEKSFKKVNSSHASKGNASSLKKIVKKPTLIFELV